MTRLAPRSRVPLEATPPLLDPPPTAGLSVASGDVDELEGKTVLLLLPDVGVVFNVPGVSVGVGKNVSVLISTVVAGGGGKSVCAVVTTVCGGGVTTRVEVAVVLVVITVFGPLGGGLHFSCPSAL